MTLGANWGASAAERASELACDPLIPDAPIRLHRAVEIDASATTVFRWLCQLKLAPYSYDLLDNLGRRSPRELSAGADRLEVGQRFMTIFALSSFDRDEHITLSSRRTAVTYALRSGPEGSTRLLARVLFDPPGGRLGASLLGNALALGDLAMMRKQLLTLKELAENDVPVP